MENGDLVFGVRVRGNWNLLWWGIGIGWVSRNVLFGFGRMGNWKYGIWDWLFGLGRMGNWEYEIWNWLFGFGKWGIGNMGFGIAYLGSVEWGIGNMGFGIGHECFFTNAFMVFL